MKQSLAIAYALKKKHKAPDAKEEHEEEMEEHEEMPDRMDMHTVARHKAKEAMSKRDRAIRMFEGGQIHDNYQSSKNSHITHPDLKDEEQDEYDPHEEPARKSNHRAMMEDSHKLGQHGEYEVGPEDSHVDAEDHEDHFEHPVENQSEGIEEDMIGRIMKQRAQVFANGGEAKHRETGYEKGVNTQTKHGKLGESSAHYDTSNPELPSFYKKLAKSEHERNLQELKEMPEPKYAHGGDVDGTHMCKGSGCLHASHGGMAHYSEGGKVANEDLPIADDMPAEYDDLHLRDGLEEHYTGKNSGDEIGNEHEDERRSDIVSKIMHSRKKKDRMPRPA